MFLTRTTVHPDTGYSIEHFAGVRGRHVSNRLRINHADTAAVTQTLLQAFTPCTRTSSRASPLSADGFGASTADIDTLTNVVAAKPTVVRHGT